MLNFLQCIIWSADINYTQVVDCVQWLVYVVGGAESALVLVKDEMFTIRRILRWKLRRDIETLWIRSPNDFPHVGCFRGTLLGGGPPLGSGNLGLQCQHRPCTIVDSHEKRSIGSYEGYHDCPSPCYVYQQEGNNP